MDPATPQSEQSQQKSLIKPGGLVDPQALREAIDLSDGDDDGHRRVRFVLSRDLNKRLDKYLADRIGFMSRSQLQRLIDDDGVTVNGRSPKASTRLRRGDVVDVVVPPPPATEIQGEDIPLDVLFEDDAIIVLNKKPGIIVHPARSHHSGTLLNALVWHFEHHSPTGGGLSGVGANAARPGVVHRLDRHTSGVMVAAKDDEAHWQLGRAFEKRRVDKRYLAVVEGNVEADVDVIDLPIGPHPNKAKGTREKMVVRHDALGKSAVTLCRVRQRFDGYTLVELELKTGRTHQIRVHLSYLGHPLVGDDMYEGSILRASDIVPMGDGSAEDTERVVMGRQALHAAVLGFAHPTTSEAVEFTAPVREDMAELIRLLRAHRHAGPVRDVPGATVDIDAAVPAVR